MSEIPHNREDDTTEKKDEYTDRLRVNLITIDPVNCDEDANLTRTEIENDGDFPAKLSDHPDAAAMFQMCPWVRRVPIFGACCQNYGPKCTLSIGIVYFLSKGMANNLMSFARYRMFTHRFGIDATRYQRLAGIASMGMSIKPLIAILSDTFAIFGYTKRWYCAACCIIGGVFLLGFGLLPPNPSSADIAAGFMFLASFCIANVDILSEGHYSRQMRQRPQAGPSLVSWVYWFILTGTVVSSTIQGPLSDRDIPQVGLIIAATLQGIAVVFFVFNWYGEKLNSEDRALDLHKEFLMRKEEANQRAAGALGASSLKGGIQKQDTIQGNDVESTHHDFYGYMGSVAAEPQDYELYCNDDDNITAAGAPAVPATAVDMDWEMELPAIQRLCCGAVEINKEVVRRNWRILAYSVLITCAVVTMMCVTVLGTKWQLLYASISVVVVCIAFSFMALPRVIAKCTSFFFCYALLYLQLPGVLDSFYMATSECLPNGPHFSNTFYVTISAVLGNVAGIFAVAAFPYVFAKQSFRLTISLTMFVQVLASLFDLIIVERWNLYVGIPDHAMYVLGDAIVYQVCHYLAYMPTVILLSRVCPRGSETMVYAVVAGFGNLGGSISGTIGSLLIEFVWPVISTPPCNFGNLRYLLIVGHICTPLLIIPLAFVLLPNARICDDLDVHGKVKPKAAATSSSLPIPPHTNDANGACSAEPVTTYH